MQRSTGLFTGVGITRLLEIFAV